jgi:hypothetical protein
MSAVSLNIRLRQEYLPRSVKPIGIWGEDGWRIKAYGIAYRGTDVREEIASAARDVVHAALPRPAQTEARYGLGFAIIHEGQDAAWLLIDWWSDESVIEQRMFKAPLIGIPEFAEVTRPLVGCVWELSVHAFERDAWVETVLAHPDNPMVDAYLARRVEGFV